MHIKCYVCIKLHMYVETEVFLLTGVERKKSAAISDILRISQNGFNCTFKNHPFSGVRKIDVL